MCVTAKSVLEELLLFVDWQGWIESVRQAKYFAPFEMFLCRAKYGMKSQKHSTLRLSGLGSAALFWSSLLFRVGSTVSFRDLELGFQDISLREHSTNFLPTKVLPTSQYANVWGQIKKPRIGFLFHIFKMGLNFAESNLQETILYSTVSYGLSQRRISSFWRWDFNVRACLLVLWRAAIWIVLSLIYKGR